MRVKRIKTYKFNELSEEIQEKLVEKQDCSEYFNSDDNKNTLEAFEKIAPIKIGDWEYGYHNFINFKLLVDYYEIENFTGKRLLAWVYNNITKYIEKGKYYSKSSYTDGVFHNKFRHSKIQKELDCSLTGYCIDNDILKALINLQETVRLKYDSYTLYDLMNDCLHDWIFACSHDVEYYQSEEYIREDLTNQDLDYDINGHIIY